MRRYVLLLCVAVWGCGGDDEARQPGGTPCLGGNCTDAGQGGSGQDAAPEAMEDGSSDAPGPDGAGPDGAGDAEASADASQDAVDEPYTGPTGTLRGTIFLSNPSEFPMEIGGEFPLPFPAWVSVWAHGKEYVGTYDSGAYEVSSIPIGIWPLVVRDEAAKNGFVSTVHEVEVAEGEQSWNAPTISRNSFVVSYGTVDPPVLRNPTLAQVLLSFESCEAEGGARLSDVTVNAPSGAEALLSHTPSGWQLSGTTSSTGVVFVANLPAELAPGEQMAVSYSVGGQDHLTPAFTIVRDAVTRVAVVVPCGGT